MKKVSRTSKKKSCGFSSNNIVMLLSFADETVVDKDGSLSQKLDNDLMIKAKTYANSQNPWFQCEPNKIWKNISPGRKSHQDLNIHLRGIEMKILMSTTSFANDNIINGYLALLSNCEGNKKVYVMTSFLMTKLCKKADVGKWTKRINSSHKYGIFSFDLILIPVCDDSHWTLFAVSTQDSEVHFYCSLGLQASETHISNLQNWLTSEAGKLTDGKGSKYKKWTFSNTACARQENSYDCGFFLMAFSECLCRNELCNKLDVTHLRTSILLDFLSPDRINARLSKVT